MTTNFSRRPPLPQVFGTMSEDFEEEHDNAMIPMVSALLMACHVLRLSKETTFTAACLLHRYFYSTNHQNTKSSSEHDNITQLGHNSEEPQTFNGQLILVSCICLACKTEEEPRRLRDFINISHMLSWEKRDRIERKNKNASGSGSSSHHCVLQWKKDPPALDGTYWAMKERLVAAEQHVLRWLGFDVCVCHPHRAVVALVLSLQEQQQSNLADVQWHRMTNRSSSILNYVAVYSSRSLTVPVLSLAMAALVLAVEESVPSTMTNLILGCLSSLENDDTATKTAKERIARVLRHCEGREKA